MRGLRVFLFVVMVLLAIKTVQAGQLCVDEEKDCLDDWETYPNWQTFYTTGAWVTYEKSFFDTQTDASNYLGTLTADGWLYESSVTLYCNTLGPGTSGGTFGRRKKLVEGVWRYKAAVYLNPLCTMGEDCTYPYDETKNPPCASDRDGDGIYDWFDPLPDDPQIPRNDFQTKDLDCSLDTYTITAGGRLVHHFREWELTPEEEKPHPHAKDWRGLFGMYREVKGSQKIVDTNYHGDLEFYTSGKDNEWFQYTARFTDGQLTSIKRDNVW